MYFEITHSFKYIFLLQNMPMIKMCKIQKHKEKEVICDFTDEKYHC